eukprot:gene33250-42994_t
MNWSRAISSGNSNYYHHHAQLDHASSHALPQLTSTPHSFGEYKPSISDNVYDRDMSELCNIILSDSFCNSINCEQYSKQNSMTTTEVSTTSTCTQYSQENFMPVNSLIMGPDNSSIPLDNHQDPGAGSYNNYEQDTFDAYGQDYYAGSGCHAATELSAAPSSFYDILPPPSSPNHALNENSPLDTSPSYRQLVSPRELQEVFDDLTRRPTDPVGKFLKEQQLSASEAIELDIQHQLLFAPKKPRTKYGKRSNLTPEERLALSRRRNREHARATRLRKKIFKQVTEARRRDGIGSGTSAGSDHHNTYTSMTTAFLSTDTITNSNTNGNASPIRDTIATSHSSIQNHVTVSTSHAEASLTVLVVDGADMVMGKPVKVDMLRMLIRHVKEHGNLSMPDMTLSEMRSSGIDHVAWKKKQRKN